MRTNLTHLSLVHDNDLIDGLDSGKPVCNDKCSTSLHQPPNSILNQSLRLKIYRLGRFVENEHARIKSQRACKSNKLFLAGGEPAATLMNWCFIPVGEASDEFVGA